MAQAVKQPLITPGSQVGAVSRKVGFSPFFFANHKASELMKFDKAYPQRRYGMVLILLLPHGRVDNELYMSCCTA